MEPCVDNGAEEPDVLSFESSPTASVVDVKLSMSYESETMAWSASSMASPAAKPHAPSGDPRWEAIRRIQTDTAACTLNFGDMLLRRRLGSGDIGSVYLMELKWAAGCMFAAKVMDKEELVSRNKEGRASIERGILELLDHPFLPTLYATLDSPRWSCLLTEFCPGGDLHVLRQRQHGKRFDEAAVRFYASEVVVALEYLHMMGIVYRDLKPENILVRSDGHIMLTDFDLSLKCDNSTASAQLVSSKSTRVPRSLKGYTEDPDSPSVRPNWFLPAFGCFQPKRNRGPRRQGRRGAGLHLVAEPIDARSMSFVGTHEYLAPEIVSGEGHGNAVDWWTLGIFIYELVYGVTPFSGIEHEITLANIMARALEFPEEPSVSGNLKDLITQLLIKDPAKRMGSTMGATSIKHHPFFDGVNWALLRCTTPPFVPRPINYNNSVIPGDDDECLGASIEFF